MGRQTNRRVWQLTNKIAYKKNIHEKWKALLKEYY